MKDKKMKVNNNGYTTYDLYLSRNNMAFICKNLIYSNQYINGLFIFTPSGENIGYGLRDFGANAVAGNKGY